jgi:hypothetical protein
MKEGFKIIKPQQEIIYDVPVHDGDLDDFSRTVSQEQTVKMLPKLAEIVINPQQPK